MDDHDEPFDVSTVARLRELPAFATTVAVAMAWPPPAHRLLAHAAPDVGRSPTFWRHSGTCRSEPHRFWPAGRDSGTGQDGRARRTAASGRRCLRSDHPVWPGRAVIGLLNLVIATTRGWCFHPRPW
jgi:hypothetical protein